MTVQDGTCNWHGTLDGNVISSKVSGAFNYVPWLNNGNDVSANTGFQHSASCTGNQSDYDGDGVSNGTDCDQYDPTVQGPNTYYRDMDGDGYGNPDVSTSSCSQPAGYVTNNYDSDDSDGKTRILLCHRGSTIAVKDNAVQGHMKHGDAAGPCANNLRVDNRVTDIFVDEFKLGSSPNPFRSNVKLEYSIPVDSRVSIKIYDMLGREITSIVNADRKAGNYTENYDGSKLTTGVYYARMIATADGKQTIQTQKLVRAD